MKIQNPLLLKKVMHFNTKMYYVCFTLKIYFNSVDYATHYIVSDECLL